MQDLRAKLAPFADPKQTAVLVVDIQNLFVGFPLHPPVEEVLPRLLPVHPHGPHRRGDDRPHPECHPGRDVLGSLAAPA